MFNLKTGQTPKYSNDTRHTLCVVVIKFTLELRGDGAWSSDEIDFCVLSIDKNHTILFYSLQMFFLKIYEVQTMYYYY